MMKASVDLSLKSGLSSGRTKLQNDCTDMVRAWRSGSQASMSYGGGMTPGHMPGQGQMMPGQFGPIRRVLVVVASIFLT